MHCPNLSELPPPPLGRTGWPWTEESPHLPEAILDGSPWPRISIITPSYNQGQFLEETIRSVLLQGYPNLEYIIIDGASTDASVEIIKKYEKYLAYWASERDKGQSDALNKGFLKSTGEILAWLNSDDTFDPGVLFTIGKLFHSHNNIDVIYGNAKIVDEDNKMLSEIRSVPFHKKAFIYGTINTHQASIFWRRVIFFKTGMIKYQFEFAMDHDLIHRFLAIGGQFMFVKTFIANYRWHPMSKSASRNPGFYRESTSTLREIWGIEHASYQYTFWHTLYFIRKLYWLIRQGDLAYIMRGLCRRLKCEKAL
jgi:glycosyltransferase involved in cell wall biosynthesis